MSRFMQCPEFMMLGETTSKNFDQRPMGFRKWEVSKEGISHTIVSVE